MGELSELGQPPGHTPSQTIGPFLAIAFHRPEERFAVGADDPDAVVIEGLVFDGAGELVTDAMVETWQADGRLARCNTDDEGRWEVRTVKPPVVATRDGTPQAPHLVVSVFARGLLDRVVTRIYFGDHDEANATDPTLAAVGDRRGTLIARPLPDAGARYGFDIRLQGDDETVFFDL